MNAKERATQFVNNHPIMFTEDKDWWIAEISVMLLEVQIHYQSLRYFNDELKQKRKAERGFAIVDRENLVENLIDSRGSNHSHTISEPTMKKNFNVDNFLEEIETCCEFFVAQEPAEPPQVLMDAATFVKNNPREFAGMSDEAAIARAVFQEAIGKIDFESR